MPIINIDNLSGITVTPLQPTFDSTSFDAANFVGYTDPTTSQTVYYSFLFSNIDGVVSHSLHAPSGAGFATFYYQVDAGGPGGGGPPGDPEVYAIGFDATADVVAPVTFTAETIVRRKEGDFYLDEPVTAELESGQPVDTAFTTLTLTAPVPDGVPQSAGYEAAAFTAWFSLTKGIDQITGDSGGLRLSFNGPLSLAARTDDTFLAIYVAPLKSAPGPIVYPPVQLKPNCAALLANARDAASAYNTAAGISTSSAALLTALKNLSDAANEAAAPCRASQVDRGLSI